MVVLYTGTSVVIRFLASMALANVLSASSLQTGRNSGTTCSDYSS